jgi:hypothetical protein
MYIYILSGIRTCETQGKIGRWHQTLKNGCPRAAAGFAAGDSQSAAEQAGFVRVQPDELHPGNHRITPNADGIRVPAVTLDDLVDKAAAQRDGSSRSTGACWCSRAPTAR